jgi:hypothetical protein
VNSTGQEEKIACPIKEETFPGETEYKYKIPKSG